MRADAETNRAEVLAAAGRLLRTQGADVSLRAIATDAGVGIATLYRHFPTREALLLGVVDTSAEQIRAAISEFHASEAPIAERWWRFAEGFRELNVGLLIEPALTDASGDFDRVATEALSMREAMLTRIEGVLDEVRRAGLVSASARADVFAFGLVQLTRRLPERSGIDIKALLDGTFHTFMRGLAVDAQG